MRKRILETNKNLCGTREWTCQTAHRIGSPSLSNCGFQVVAWASHGHLLLFFSHDFSIHTLCSLRQAIASGEWLYTQTENVLALRLAVLPCISVCIGCGYMVVCRIRVLSHNITRTSTSIHVACGTSRALVGSNLFGCGHMKCFVSNCNGKIEMNVSYLELYCSTASSLLCSCRYFLFSSQIKFPFCLAPKFTLPAASKSNLKIDG